MELRPKIVKLAKMIGGLTGMVNKIDENAPEYYSLECCVSDEQADVAMAMGLRKPKTAEQIAKKIGKPVEYVQKVGWELAQIGVCKFYIDELDGKEKYMIQIFAPGILEMMVCNDELLAKHPQIGKAFEEYTRTRVKDLVPMLPRGMSMMRVIPIESAIDGNSKAVPYEKISYYLDKYDKFSVSNCSCRASRRVLGQGCGHLEKDMCIQMGTGAEYFISTGRAREISKEEALAIMKKAEENGLMHQMPNIEGEGESAAICNCCSCSCFAMRIGTMYQNTEAIRSNFVAEVNKENCVACGQCVEHCPTNAVKLGQKLCSVSDKPIGIPEYRKITTHKWTEKDWNVDYRTNREDTLKTGTSPCKSECPAHIAVQGYIRLAALGKYTEALELIKKENPLPAVCGRICPHKCEDACTRAGVDRAVAIDDIKRFIADKDKESGERFIPVKKHDYSEKKMAVVGSGPAGLSCAYFMAVDGYPVTVFEKEEKLGGMLTLGIPAFRLEKDVIQAEIEILKELGVEFKTGVEIGKDITIENLREQGYDGIYLAIGAQGGRKLGIEGEDNEGVMTGVEFLKNVALEKQEKLDGEVVVIGGGNVAIDVARTATRMGAKTVNMFCLEAKEEMPALEEEIVEAEEENVLINNSWGPNKIVVENGKVVGVEFKKCVSVFDEDKKFAPKFDESQTKIVPANHVLVSVGQTIVWGDMLNGLNVELNRNNTVKADPTTYATGEKDIFVGGDAYTGPQFAINAIAAGKEGAISLHRAVWPGQDLLFGREKKNYHSFDRDDAKLEGYDNTERQRPLKIRENEGTFKDTRQTFTEEQMKAEANRCLGCGAAYVDPFLCVGCGQCTTKCKFDAISLKKVYNSFAPVFEKLPIEVAKNAVKRAGKIVRTSVKDKVSGKKY